MGRGGRSQLGAVGIAPDAQIISVRIASDECRNFEPADLLKNSRFCNKKYNKRNDYYAVNIISSSYFNMPKPRSMLL